MKKTILSFFAMLVCTAMFAVEGETAAFELDIYVGTDNIDNIYLTEAPSYTNGYDNGYDSYKLAIGGDTLISSTLGDKELAVVARPDLAGTYINFQASSATTYKMVVLEDIAKAGLWIKDNYTNQMYKLEDGTEFEFTQDANSLINKRFVICRLFTPDEGALQVCHQYDQLEIKNNPYSTNIVVKDAKGAVVMDELPENTPQTISLADLPKGRYTVEFNDGKEVFVISVKPTMTLTPDTSFAASINKGEQFLFACTPRTEAGTYTETFQSAGGADSIVHLYLSYIPCDTAYGKAQFTLCQKELPYTYKDVLQRQYVINSDSTIIARFPDMAASGCDSIATISFKVYRVMENKKESAGICEGSFYEWRGRKLTEAKTYYDTVRYAATGCDSAYYQMTLSVDKMTKVNITKNICASSLPYVYYGGKRNWRVYNDTIINDTVIRPSGCDSIAIVSIVVNRLKVDDVKDTTICEGSSFMWRGQNVDGKKAAYFDTLRYATGCDSARFTLRVKVNRLMVDSKENKTICEGSFYEWRGQKLTEAKTYYDTVPYKKSGCDSAYYQLTLSVEPLKYETKAITICQRQLPYYYKGKLRTYRIMGDSIFNDTVPSKVGAKCDSITTVTITVEYPTIAPIQDTVVCPGAVVEWRGKVLTKPGMYYDTLHYESGCMSDIYTLRIKEFAQMRQRVMDTICLSDAKTLYPQFNITKSGLYVDTLASQVTGCDSIVTYAIFLLEQPKLPTLRHLSSDLMPVVCSKPMNTQLLEMAIKTEIDQMKDPKKSEIAEFWLEAQLTPTSVFKKIDDQLLPKGDGQIKVRIAAVSACGDSVYSDIVSRQIGWLTADNDETLDNLPAVKKYDNWLLMIHLAQINEMGIDIEEEDVTWYQIQGSEMDPVDQIKDDRMLGTGFYYTADQSLPGAYYAVIEDSKNGCGALMRTVVLNCKPAKKIDLTPRTLRSGEAMTVSNLNPEASAQMSIYYPDGKLINRMATEGAEDYTIQPQQGAGIYLLRVENGDQKESFKFIITQ